MHIFLPSSISLITHFSIGSFAVKLFRSHPSSSVNQIFFLSAGAHAYISFLRTPSGLEDVPSLSPISASFVDSRTFSGIYIILVSVQKKTEGFRS